MTTCFCKRYAANTFRFIAVGYFVQFSYSGMADESNTAKEHETLTVEIKEVQKFTDEKVSIEYSVEKDGIFKSVQVNYTGKCAFRYTSREPEGGVYYSDPRSGVSVTMQFTKPGKLILVSVGGLNVPISKHYTWNDVMNKFEAVEME